MPFEWTNENTIKFLELLETERVIWDIKNISHKQKHKVHDAWRRISNAFSVPIDELKSKKRSLMATFRPLLKKKQNSIRSGAGVDDIYNPIWFAFDIMERFLGPPLAVDDTLHSIDEQENVEPNRRMETMPPKSPQAQTSQTDFSISTNTKRNTNTKKTQLDHIISEADTKINDSFEILTNVLKERKREEDECDVYASLLAKRLRKYPERMRNRIMYKIDGLLLDNPYPDERSLTPSTDHFLTPSPQHDPLPSPHHNPPLSPQYDRPPSPQHDPPPSPQNDPPASPQHDPPPSPQHDPPASPQHDPPPSPQHDPPPSPQHDPPPSPNHDPPASPQHDPPTSPQHDPPPSPQHDPPPSPQHNPPPAPQHDPPPSPQHNPPPAPQHDPPPSPQHAPSPFPRYSLTPSPKYAPYPSPRYVPTPPRYAPFPSPQYASSTFPRYSPTPSPQYAPYPYAQYAPTPPRYVPSTSPQYGPSPSPRYAPAPSPQYAPYPSPQHDLTTSPPQTPIYIHIPEGNLNNIENEAILLSFERNQEENNLPPRNSRP